MVTQGSQWRANGYRYRDRESSENPKAPPPVTGSRSIEDEARLADLSSRKRKSIEEFCPRCMRDVPENTSSFCPHCGCCLNCLF